MEILLIIYVCLIFARILAKAYYIYKCNESVEYMLKYKFDNRTGIVGALLNIAIFIMTFVVIIAGICCLF